MRGRSRCITAAQQHTARDRMPAASGGAWADRVRLEARGSLAAHIDEGKGLGAELLHVVRFGEVG